MSLNENAASLLPSSPLFLALLSWELLRNWVRKNKYSRCPLTVCLDFFTFIKLGIIEPCQCSVPQLFDYHDTFLSFSLLFFRKNVKIIHEKKIIIKACPVFSVPFCLHKSWYKYFLIWEINSNKNVIKSVHSRATLKMDFLLNQ